MTDFIVNFVAPFLGALSLALFTLWRSSQKHAEKAWEEVRRLWNEANTHKCRANAIQSKLDRIDDILGDDE